MNIVYTDHACRKAFLREITKHEIDAAIEAGKVTPGHENKLVFTDQNSRVSAIVAQDDPCTYVVVTTYRHHFLGQKQLPG